MIKTTNYNGADFTVIDYKNEWYFIAKEVSEYLEYSDAEAMTRRLSEDEKLTLKGEDYKSIICYLQNVGYKTSSKSRSITIISEIGLYEAILGSQKQEAKEFKKWVKETIKLLRQQSGLEAYQAFRMMDKEIQKQCHSFISEQGVLGDKADCIVMNKNVNELTSNIYDINPPIKKGDMEKIYPEMLVDRQKIQNDYCVLFGYTKSHKQSKELISNKVNCYKMDFSAFY